MYRVIILLLLVTNSIVLLYAQQTFTAYLPKDGTVSEDQTPLFYWNEVKGANQYELQIASDELFNEVMLTYTTPDFNYILSDPLPYGEYFWRIKAIVSEEEIQTKVYKLTIFIPNQLPEISLWLRPDMGVETDFNGKVIGWIDQTPNSLNFNQNIANKRPEVDTNGFSELPTMKFNGQQVMDGGNILNIGTKSRTMYTVGQIGGENQSIYSKSLATFANNRWALIAEGSLYTSLYHDLTERHITIDANDNFGFKFFQIGIDREQSKHTFQINVGQVFESELSSSYNLSSNRRFLVGAYNNSDDSGEVAFLNGNVSEIIFVDNVDIESQEKITSYIKDRYMPHLNLGPDIIVDEGFCDEVELDATENYVSYLWSNGSTEQKINVERSGAYWVKVKDQLGFEWVDTVYVNLIEPDMPARNLYCTNESVTWDANLGNTYNYLWSTNETSEAIVINSPGNYHLRITDNQGCTYFSDTIYFDEDTFENDVSLGPDQELCTGNVIRLIEGDSAIVSYSWSTGDTTQTVEVEEEGVYQLEVINDNGCVASDQIDITIIGVAPTIELGMDTIICQNALFEFEDLSTTIDGSEILFREWDFGNNYISNESSGTHVYSESGVYEVSLFVDVESDCSNSKTINVIVNEQPELTFESINHCQMNETGFSMGQITPTIIDSLIWDFDDISSGEENTASSQNPTHTFEEAGSYNVQLIGTDINGCSDTLVKLVEIAPSPIAAFSFNEVCAGGVVDFMNETTVAPEISVASQQWQLGDGTFTSQSSPSKSYTVQGDYEINLTVVGSNGCSTSDTKTMKVHGIPQIDFSHAPICAGLSATLNDNSFVPNGSVAEVIWRFDDGTEIEGFSVNHTFENSGEQSIFQTVLSAFGCERSGSSQVLINPLLRAGFTSSPLALLVGTPTEFINTSQGATNYLWSIDTFFNSTNESLTYTFPEEMIGDTITVNLYVTNSSGCEDEKTMEYVVLRETTDLAINQLFIQEQDGFYSIGVQLENKGTTPILEVDLFLKTVNTPMIKEKWKGTLQAGEKEIYVFNASTSTTVYEAQENENFICVKGNLISQLGFIDNDLFNNERCKNLSATPETILMTPFPNPVSNELNVRVVTAKEEQVSIKIYDNLGRLVANLSEKELLKEGLHQFMVDVKSWRQGNYNIILSTETEIKRSSFVVMR